MFRDRVHAGHELAGALRGYSGAPDTLVLALPRGGVVVAAGVARALGLPLDVVVTRKIGAPGNPEYAVAAIDADGAVVPGDLGGASDEYIRSQVAVERDEIARRLRTYRGDRPPLEIEGRTVILVDDGIATGLTVRAAVRYLRAHNAGRIVVAVPVAPQDTADRLRLEADEVVTLAEPSGFYAVGQFYSEFGQTTDDEVISLLRD
ncbi:MAG: phosphoribosyltransferase family protein [Coriobacteriia bacterium]